MFYSQMEIRSGKYFRKLTFCLAGSIFLWKVQEHVRYESEYFGLHFPEDLIQSKEKSVNAKK